MGKRSRATDTCTSSDIVWGAPSRKKDIGGCHSVGGGMVFWSLLAVLRQSTLGVVGKGDCTNTVGSMQ